MPIALFCGFQWTVACFLNIEQTLYALLFVHTKQKATKCCHYVAEGDSADIQFKISEITGTFICMYSTETAALFINLAMNNSVNSKHNLQMQISKSSHVVKQKQDALVF